MWPSSLPVDAAASLRRKRSSCVEQLSATSTRAAGCPVPADDVCVSETLAGIRREAVKTGQMPAREWPQR